MPASTNPAKQHDYFINSAEIVTSFKLSTAARQRYLNVPVWQHNNCAASIRHKSPLLRPRPLTGVCSSAFRGPGAYTILFCAYLGCGAIQFRLSVTVTAPFFPVAVTAFAPLRSVIGQVKIQFVLLRVPCDAPLRNNSTESQLAYTLAVKESASRFVK